MPVAATAGTATDDDDAGLSDVDDDCSDGSARGDAAGRDRGCRRELRLGVGPGAGVAHYAAALCGEADNRPLERFLELAAELPDADASVASAADGGAATSGSRKRSVVLLDRSGVEAVADVGGIVGAVAARFRAAFDVELRRIWVLLYPDGRASIGWHHDTLSGRRGAECAGDRGLIAAFGSPRTVRWQELGTGAVLDVCMRNGDMLAFTGTANEQLRHCVPSCEESRPRIAVVAYGVVRGEEDLPLPSAAEGAERLAPPQVG
eukprot:TRINITY_DN68141_c0_g1_i1.p1 TRINITY_DN68141_c0_g1~~TRINITY_DN68141_c0_g1_i1.p1  ORF type:complete len:263 (-),score=74.93 TRINITY_DN68141_c0_g1_i1:344-1132(-)